MQPPTHFSVNSEKPNHETPALLVSPRLGIPAKNDGVAGSLQALRKDRLDLHAMSAPHSYTVERKFLEDMLALVEDGHVFGSERALMAGRIQHILNGNPGPSQPFIWCDNCETIRPLKLAPMEGKDVTGQFAEPVDLLCTDCRFVIGTTYGNRCDAKTAKAAK